MRAVDQRTIEGAMDSASGESGSYREAKDGASGGSRRNRRSD
jgi:hypothetical protein